MKKLILGTFLSLSTVFALAPKAWGEDVPLTSSASAEELSVRLLAAKTSIAPDTNQILLGLEVTPKEGWKTYWRTAGVAGLPARIDWSEAENLQQANIAWPAPHRFTFSGLETFGYKTQHILPIPATLKTAGHAVTATAIVDIMTCETICIPFTFKVSLRLPQGLGEDSLDAPRLTAALQNVPDEGIRHNITLSDARYDADSQSLEIKVMADPPLNDPDLLVEARGFMFGKPVMTGSHPQILRAPVATHPRDKIFPAPETAVTVTIIDGERTAEKRITPLPVVLQDPPTEPISPASATILPILGLASALLAAFIGGLILNLMPCVLPVLSLKLLSVIGHKDSPPKHVRLSFLASAAGIITSFLALAIVAISLRAAGHSIGWGMQFQHPPFIIILMIILTLFAASLWGLLHIPLPRFMADAINDRLPVAGSDHDRTLLGNFVTGAFATVLATPCSAPFVGTAIGFALAGSSFVLLLVAFTMGLGLATPFLLVAAYPQMARFLPRAGRWMIWFKGLMGLALLGTVVWLMTVLGRLSSPLESSVIAGAMFFGLFILWIRASIKNPAIFYKGLLAMAIGAISLGYSLQAEENNLARDRLAPQENNAQLSSTLVWKKFNEAEIAEAISQGKTVFVDVTAEWCLTCLANKKMVIDTPAISAALTAPHIVAMRADWSKPDPAIAAYLKKNGRYGIPFNIVYGPKAPQGLPLSEVLTSEAVLNALKLATP